MLRDTRSMHPPFWKETNGKGGGMEGKTYIQ